MRRIALVALAVLLYAMWGGAVAHAQGDVLAPGSTNILQEGPIMWAVLSIALTIMSAVMTKHIFIAVGVGALPLFAAIARGHFSPIVLLLLVLLGASMTVMYIIFRR